MSTIIGISPLSLPKSHTFCFQRWDTQFQAITTIPQLHLGKSTRIRDVEGATLFFFTLPWHHLSPMFTRSYSHWAMYFWAGISLSVQPVFPYSLKQAILTFIYLKKNMRLSKNQTKPTEPQIHTITRAWATQILNFQPAEGWHAKWHMIFLSFPYQAELLFSHSELQQSL